MPTSGIVPEDSCHSAALLTGGLEELARLPTYPEPVLHLEYRLRRGWKPSRHIGGCEPLKYRSTWRWPRDGRIGRERLQPTRTPGLEPGRWLEPAYVARRSRSSHKLLKVLVEPPAAHQRTAAPDKAGARW